MKTNDLEECVCPTCGACPSMGTANTMQLMGEIFNLVLPGTSCIPAVDSLKIRKAREAGEYMVEMVKKNIRPSQLITRETLLNAITIGLGYYDQAHFNRDFKQFTSLTPKLFIDVVCNQKQCVVV